MVVVVVGIGYGITDTGKEAELSSTIILTWLNVVKWYLFFSSPFSFFV